MLSLRRWRRFIASALAATLSVLAISQGARAYDSICINGQCGQMIPTNSSPYAEYQPQDYSEPKPISPPVEPAAQPIWNSEPQSASPAPAAQPIRQSAPCNIYFHPLIPQASRDLICKTISSNPDLEGTIPRVDYNPQSERGEYGMIAASMNAPYGSMSIREEALRTNADEQEEIIAHEAAHSKAWKIWGSYEPPTDSEFYQAYEAEGAVSGYGETGMAEAFSEAYAMSVTGDPELDRYPKTKAAIERIRWGNG